LDASSPYSILASIVDLPQADLAAALTVLEKSTLLLRRGHPPQVIYAFKHALVRDAVYESLLRSRRQILHRHIVDAIEADIPHLAASQPELIAHHCAGAGLTEKAIAYGLKAGAQAVRRAANLEAIEHFRRVLSLNSEQPESPNRARTELAILSQLGPALMSVHGWPASEVGDVYKRADEIARRLKSSIELTPPLAGLWLFHISRGQFAKAEEISAELFRIAHELDDPNVLLQAHHAAWPTQFLSGRFANADQHIHVGMELYDEKRHEQHRYTYLGHDPAVCALSIGAIVRWLLGYPDQAARLEQQAVSMARRLQHAPSLAHGLWFIGDGQLARGDFAAVIATATELLELCEANRLPQPRATALMFLGWGLARSGETTEATRRLEEGLRLWEKLGARSYLPRSLCLLAEAHLLAGRHADGLEQIARALQIATQTGEHWYVAQMHHLRAELLLKARGADWKAAEACLNTALSIARAQGAKAWELRAGMLSARLLAERGERRKAYEFLHSIYASFTEGTMLPTLNKPGRC
jgi:predicted ATPase